MKCIERFAYLVNEIDTVKNSGCLLLKTDIADISDASYDIFCKRIFE